MIDFDAKVKRIRHESERQFATSFFNHNQWTYQPGPFYLGNGTKYFPDFYDQRRDVLIEVTNTRGSFHRNERKYKLFVTQYPSLKLEFRYHTGRPFHVVDAGDRYKIPHMDMMKRPAFVYDHHYDLRALMPELRKFFITTRWEYTSVKRYLGMDIQPLRFALTNWKPYCKEPLFRALTEMLKHFAEKPEEFPVSPVKLSYPENSAKSFRGFNAELFPMAKTKLPEPA